MLRSLQLTDLHKIILWLLSLLFMAFQCDDKRSPSIQTSPVVELKLGEEKTLVVDRKQVRVKFKGVREERCSLSDCMTCYGGYVYAMFELWIDEQKVDDLTLQRISCIPAGDLKPDNPNLDTNERNSLIISLVNITEFEKDNQPTNNYTAKVQFTTL